MSEPPWDEYEWDERSTRAAVAGRSGGYCEWCGKRATNVHHRRNVSQGGKWRPSNCLHLCGSGTTGCHGVITRSPKWAHEHGATLWYGEDPEEVPVRTPNGVLCLTDDIAPPAKKRR